MLVYIGAGFVLGFGTFLMIFLWRPSVFRKNPGLSPATAPAVSEELAAAVINLHPDILFLLDEKGVVLECRGPALLDLGRDPESFVGKSLSQTLPPELAAEVTEKIRELRVPSERIVLERTWPASDAHRVLEIRLTRMHDKRFLAMVRNVNSLGKLGDEQFRRNKFESVALVAGGLAHDLNNSLAVIQGFLSVARVQLSQPERALASLDKASAATARAGKLTGRLGALARDREVVRSAVSVRELAEEAASLVLIGTPCQLILEAGSGPWVVEADTVQLSQVFHNLVFNAVQAMPGGGTVTLAFLRRPGDTIAISIIDEGPGIPVGVQPKIFDPYFSLRPDGTGLGLSVAREVVLAHGGTIEVESREGQGTTVTVTLSAARPAGEALTNPGLGASLKGNRVLIMEDEGGLRDLMVEVSLSLDLETTPCCNGREAVDAFDLALAEGRPFSLIISDLLIPGDMGGREMISQLRTRPAPFRALAVTGFSTDRFVEDFRHQGFDVIVGKPFTVDELKTRIVELMRSPWKTTSTV